MNLRLLGIIGAVLTVLLAADGIYMLVSHYNDNETANFNLPDGATVLIAAGILLIITVIAFVLSARTNASGIVPTPVAPEVEVDTTSDVQRRETIG